MDLSDHSSDDEDYDPTMDVERDAEEEEGAAIRPLESALTKVSRRRANAAADMFKALKAEEKANLKALKEKTALVTGAKRAAGAVLEKVLAKSKMVELRGGDDANLLLSENVSVSVYESSENNNDKKGGSSSSSAKKKKKNTTKAGGAKAVASRNAKLLAKIFGKSQASGIMDIGYSKRDDDLLLAGGPKKGGKKATGKVAAKKTSSSSSGSSSINIGALAKHDKVSSEVTAAVRATLRGIARMTKVVEKRKFAGQEITIERNEMTAVAVKDQFADDEEKAAAAAAAAAAGGGGGDAGKKKRQARSSNSNSSSSGGVDSVLDTIRGPKSISTVTKSAFDWQTHKVKEGLEDELAPAAKDGYLARQDFLTRVDHRTFEKERDERLRQQTTTRQGK